MARSRPVRWLVAGVLVAAATASGCGGSGSVPVHGRVFKTVGRPCALLSAAFPGVAHRIVTFVDEVGTQIGRAVSGADRQEPIGSTGCRISAPFAVDLPARHAYAADVSSTVTALPR